MSRGVIAAERELVVWQDRGAELGCGEEVLELMIEFPSLAGVT